MRSRLVIVAALTLVVGVDGACRSGDGRPYSALSPEALQYVIPDSDGWGSGRLCPDAVDCSGPITVDVIERYDWFRITDLTIEGDRPSAASVQVGRSVAEARASGHVADARVEVRAWGPDVDDVAEVLSSGFEVWAGVDAENTYAVVFSAFDAQGRLAGVGHAAAEYFTVPVANLAAETNAASGFTFLDPLMSR